jgi:hypothetical protein
MIPPLPHWPLITALFIHFSATSASSSAGFGMKQGISRKLHFHEPEKTNGRPWAPWSNKMANTCGDLGITRVGKFFGSIALAPQKKAAKQAGRVAICFTGQARALPLAYASLVSGTSQLFPFLKTGGLDADYFYVGEAEATYRVWEPFINSLVEPEAKFIYSKPPEFKSDARGRTWLYKEAKDKTGVETVKFNMQAVQQLARRLDGYQEDPNHAVYDMKSGLIQLWQFEKCKKLVQAAEDKLSAKYQRFARVRTDVLLRQGDPDAFKSLMKESMPALFEFKDKSFDDPNVEIPIFTVVDFILVLPGVAMPQVLGSLSTLHSDFENSAPQKSQDLATAELTSFWVVGLREKAKRVAWIDWAGGIKSALLRSANYPLNCYNVEEQDVGFEFEKGRDEQLEASEVGAASFTDWGLPPKPVAVGCYGLKPTSAELCGAGVCQKKQYEQVREECRRAFGIYAHD